MKALVLRFETLTKTMLEIHDVTDSIKNDRSVSTIAFDAPLHTEMTRLGTKIISDIKNQKELIIDIIPHALAFFVLISKILEIIDIIDNGVKNTKVR